MPVSFSRPRIILCAALACLAGCQPHDSDVGTLSPRGGGSETTLVGRVLDDSGRAVEGAAIWLRNEEDSPLDQGGIDSGSAGEAAAYSDADGKYRIDAVHTGLRYLIECRRSEGKAAAVFAEADDQDTVHAPDAVLRPTGTIRGRVRVPDSLLLGSSTTPTYAYIPGLWQRTTTEPGGTAFEIRDVPAGTYNLRLQPAYPHALTVIGMLELTGVHVGPGDTTDLGVVTLPSRASTTASPAYARDSEVVANFETTSGSQVNILDVSAVLGNRIVFLYDLSGLLAGISDRIKELDALEVIYLLSFRNESDSLAGPDGAPAKALSPAISELPHLRRLWLPQMPASGYPRWTGNFPALTSLNLSEAGLASIPDWVLERKRLTYLDLSGNRLEAIPADLSGMRNLRILALDGNGLHALPPVLLTMKSLQGVNLRRNRICATTPAERAWITRQDSLWTLQRDPLDGYPDTLAWEATQVCGTP
jgi:hypothetical protein